MLNVDRIISVLNNGGGVSVELTGINKVFHAVVVKDVFNKIVTKINGNIITKTMLTIMDPARGFFRNIPLYLVTGNIWYISK